MRRIESDIYHTYKYYTNSFLSWILDSSSSNIANNKSKNKKYKYTTSNITILINQLVQKDFSSLSVNAQKRFLTILNDCQEAIKLREIVGTRLGTDNGHKMFIQCLKDWKKSLQDRFQTLAINLSTNDINYKESKRKELNMNNAYSIFIADDDEDIDNEITDNSFNTTTLVNAIDVVDTIDFSFEEDLRFQILCFIFDLEDILDIVANCWIKVKEEKLSIITATTVTTSAILAIENLSTVLELTYPAIQEFTDLFSIFNNYFPDDFLMNRSILPITKQQEYFQKSKYTKHIYMKESAFAEMMCISHILTLFRTAIPKNNNAINMKENIFGVSYDEDIFQQQIPWIYIDKDIGMNKENSRIVVFLMKELSLLRNIAVVNNDNYNNKSMLGPFFNLFKKYCEDPKHHVTIPLVFAILCWSKSVIYLQGNAFIKRTLSITKSNLHNIEKRLDDVINKGNVMKADKDLGKYVKMLQSNTQHSLVEKNASFLPAWRHNPYAANCVLVDSLMHYLSISCESLHITSRFRAFGHLYNALLCHRLIKNIPFIDEVLVIYDKMIFCPSRSKHGDFVKTYLLSSHLTAAAVSHILNNKPIRKHNEKRDIKVRESMHADQLSKAYNFFYSSDCIDKGMKYKNMQSNLTQSLSYIELLNVVKDLTNKELLESRVLSRDVFAINDTLSELFEELTDIIDRRSYYNDYIMNGKDGDLQYRTNRAAEDSVMMPLIYMLDIMNLDGESINASFNLNEDMKKFVNDKKYFTIEIISQYTKLVARKIEEKFNSYQSIESVFYIIPKTINPISEEYGNANITDHRANQQQQSDVSINNFSSWMDRFEDESSNLSKNEINQLKHDIKIDPFLISHRDYSENPTILHHLVAGKHESVELVEWLINMGALNYALNWEQNKSPLVIDNVAYDVKCDLPVVKAIKYGSFKVVRLIIEMDSYRCINFKSNKDGNSLLHLSILNNHKNIYQYLKVFGADLSVINNKNQKIFDMTNDKQFKSELKSDYDVYIKEVYRIANHVSKDQELYDARVKRDENVKNAIKQQGITTTNANVITGTSTSNSNKCAGVNCSNPGTQSCKRCKEKGRTVKFCSFECLTKNYDTHKLIHK